MTEPQPPSSEEFPSTLTTCRRAAGRTIAETGVSDERLVAIGSTVVKALGISDEMTVAELRESLAIAMRAQDMLSLAESIFKDPGVRRVTAEEQGRTDLLSYIVNGDDQ